MNRLRDYWDEDDRQRKIREDAIRRDRQVGAILMLGLFSLFPLVVLACHDDTETVVRQAPAAVEVASAPKPEQVPVTVVPAVDTTTPVEVSVIPENPTFGEGETAFHERRYDDATEIFSIWSADHPENVWGHYMYGLSALRAGRYVDAEVGFGNALEIDPRHVKSLRNVTRLYVETGRAEEALGDIEFAIEVDPQSGESYRLLALVQDQLGLADDAIDSYKHALTLDSTDAWSMNNLGLLYIQQSRYEDALGPLARAVELKDDSPVFFNNLGIALEASGHEGDAAESFRKAVALDAGYDRAQLSLERLEARDAVDVFTADLDQLAIEFGDTIESWRQPVAATPLEIDPVDIDSVATETPQPVEESGSETDETDTVSGFEPISLRDFEWVYLR